MKILSLTLILFFVASRLFAANSYEQKWAYYADKNNLNYAFSSCSSSKSNSDYDGDGYPDIVLTFGNTGEQDSYSIRIISGRNHSELFVSPALKGFPSVSLASDMDQDGVPEFILSQYTYIDPIGEGLTYTYSIEVYSGQTGKLEWALDELISRSTVSINLADVDKDGRDEFIITTTDEFSVSVLVYGAKGVAGAGAEVELVPQAISAQSFPNPFNSDTLIEFTLPQAGAVQISLFDGTGRQLAVRRMENLPAGVARTALSSLTSAQLPSGTYFVDVSQDGSGTTRQIIKLR